MAVCPIVVAGRQDERMPDALERVVYCLVILVEARQQTHGWIGIVTSWVILEIADMNDKGEVSLVQSCQDALVFLPLHRSIWHVADEAKLKGTVLQLCGCIADSSK